MKKDSLTHEAILPQTRLCRFSGDIDERGEIKATITSFNNEDSYGDVMKEGCCDDFIKDTKEIPALWSHSRAEIVGRWKNFEVVGDRLEATAYLTEGIQRAEETITLIKDKLIDSVSIGFRAKEYSFEQREDGYWAYNFYKIDIRETSFVLEPANERAEIISLRDESGNLNVRHLERHLLASGLTRSEVFTLVKPYAESMRDSAITLPDNPDVSDSVDKDSVMVSDLIKFLEGYSHARR